MLAHDKPYWFPAKRFGWGWSWPTAWQGWVVIVTYFSLLMAGAIGLRPYYGAIWFVIYTMALSVVLLAICWLKGEPPQWRWGNK